MLDRNIWKSFLLNLIITGGRLEQLKVCSFFTLKQSWLKFQPYQESANLHIMRWALRRAYCLPLNARISTGPSIGRAKIPLFNKLWSALKKELVLMCRTQIYRVSEKHKKERKERQTCWIFAFNHKYRGGQRGIDPLGSKGVLYILERKQILSIFGKVNWGKLSQGVNRWRENLLFTVISANGQLNMAIGGRETTRANICFPLVAVVSKLPHAKKWTR